ncbi:hypothetical protein V8F20_005682 [Naviculisporaceae sp. PSN 640]
MRSAVTFGLLQLAGLALGQTYTVDPPTTAPADTIQDCTNWVIGEAGQTCESIASDYWIDVSQLYRYNPSLRNGCNIVTGTSYCVEENWGIPPPEPSTTTSTTPTSTANPTPTPTQPGGMVPGCTKFYFVKPTDTCSSVLATNGLTISQLYALNPGVGSNCAGLWLEVYLCVAGPTPSGPVTTTSSTSTSTAIPTGPNGIATPTPTMPPSIVSNCNKFYFVEPGTSCSAVLSNNGITLAQLFAWNSGVGADCSGMWANVHLCVGVIGGPTTTSTTSTSTGIPTGPNGIATPTPTQPPSIVSNCNKFYFVQQGTSCNAVLSANGITLAQLFAWNSGVGADCSGMWANVHLCVGVIGGGGGPTTTSRTTTTTTTPGNGITTPTPTQPPSIVSNCNKFYFVQPGTGCSTVLSVNGISLAQLYAWNSGVGADCSGMWAGVHLCVGVIGGAPAPTTTTRTTTTTTRGNGVATPTPTQPGMVTNCKTFYKVGSGDTCDTITSKTSVSRANLLRWNTQLGSSCNVWLDYYLCIAVL